MQNTQAPDLQASDEMVRAAQAGDSAAFSTLLEQHYDLMYRFALKYAGVPADAEDITQQACMKLAKSIGQFRFESAFSTWLYRLVINCAKDWYRKTRVVQVSLPKSLGGEGNDGVDGIEALVEPMATNAQGEVHIQLQQVLALVSTLGEGFREAVVLVLGEGMSHREASEVLGIKESTVSWRLHETKKRLAAMEESS